MNGHLKGRVGPLAILFLITRTAIGVVLSAPTPLQASMCPPYAASVHQATGVIDAGSAICAPDGEYASVGLDPDSELILDMGVDNQIADEPGLDFYYYERPYESGIHIDQVEVAVAQDNGAGNPGQFTVVFIWGDGNPDNNGRIPPGYLPEEPDKPINGSDLHNDTGIGIDIGDNDGSVY